MVWFALYIAAIVAANWLIATFSLIPVGPLLVPAGTFAAGLVFGLRDLLHRDKGPRWALAAIGLGALLSAALDPLLAFASFAAFFVSELLDLLVYVRLRERGWTAAVIGSNVAGGLVDTWLFLALAGFWSWPALVGVVVVKWAMTLPVLGLGAIRDGLSLRRRPA